MPAACARASYRDCVESLALLAAVIVASIVALGLVSMVIAIRSPHRVWARVISTVFAVPAVLSGVWLAMLGIGTGGRAIGACTAAAGCAALVRLWRRNR